MKQAIRYRLPGGTIFNSVIKYLFMNSSAIDKNNPLETALFNKKKLVFKQYFLGYTRSKSSRYRYYKYFYDILCEIFTPQNNEPQSFLNLNGIYIPKPLSDHHIDSFVNEIIDFLLPGIVDNRPLIEAAYGEGPYELDEVTVSHGDIVIDCGANAGLFSAAASFKGANVYAFEPSEHIIEHYLSKTAEYNRDIFICKYAVSNKCEKLKFVSDDENIITGHLTFDETVSNNGKKTVLVDTVSLDDFVNKNNLSSVDFIKADIEGAERYMLKGAESVLKEFAPKISVCTYHLEDDPEVLREIILKANPNYIIKEKHMKMYAHVPK